ncbi:MAG: hypothetical protein LBE53_01260 [Paucimonas sp.]|jgi:electron transport complex protein RnfA|nr:hypothetical protein [Paucimonas sp.]
MNDYVLVLVSAALVNHLLLLPGPVDRVRLQALGLCVALLVMSTLIIGQCLLQWLLFPLQLQDLRLFLLLPLLAALAWVIPELIRRLRPQWPVDGLTPLLAGNALVLGLPLQLGEGRLDLWPTLLQGVFAGLGFWLALALLADLRERSRHEQIPQALRGLPIELLGAGVMTMAFSGFNGLFTQ